MDNKTLTRNFYAALTEGRLDVIDELVTEDFIEHEDVPTEADGRDGLHEMFESLHAAFSASRRRASRCWCRWPMCCASKAAASSSTGA
jgi:ketosteroid isomerase-like protein